jgi:hypothetical protein
LYAHILVLLFRQCCCKDCIGARQLSSSCVLCHSVVLVCIVLLHLLHALLQNLCYSSSTCHTFVAISQAFVTHCCNTHFAHVLYISCTIFKYWPMTCSACTCLHAIGITIKCPTKQLKHSTHLTHKLAFIYTSISQQIII